MASNIDNETIFNPPCQTIQGLQDEQLKYELELRGLNHVEPTENDKRLLVEAMSRETEPWKLRSNKNPTRELEACRGQINYIATWIEKHPTQLDNGHANLVLHFIWRLKRVGEEKPNTRLLASSGEVDTLLRTAKGLYQRILDLSMQKRSTKMQRSPTQGEQVIGHSSTRIDIELNDTINTQSHDLDQSVILEENPNAMNIQEAPASQVPNPVVNTELTGQNTINNGNDTATNRTELEHSLLDIDGTTTNDTTGIFEATQIPNDNEFLQLSQGQYDPNTTRFVHTVNGRPAQRDHIIPDHSSNDGISQTNPLRIGVPQGISEPIRNLNQLAYIEDTQSVCAISEGQIQRIVQEFSTQAQIQAVLREGVNDSVNQTQNRIENQNQNMDNGGAIPKTSQNAQANNMPKQSNANSNDLNIQSPFVVNNTVNAGLNASRMTQTPIVNAHAQNTQKPLVDLHVNGKSTQLQNQPSPSNGGVSLQIPTQGAQYQMQGIPYTLNRNDLIQFGNQNAQEQRIPTPLNGNANTQNLGQGIQMQNVPNLLSENGQNMRGEQRSPHVLDGHIYRMQYKIPTSYVQNEFPNNVQNQNSSQNAIGFARPVPQGNVLIPEPRFQREQSNVESANRNSMHTQNTYAQNHAYNMPRQENYPNMNNGYQNNNSNCRNEAYYPNNANNFSNYPRDNRSNNFGNQNNYQNCDGNSYGNNGQERFSQNMPNYSRGFDNEPNTFNQSYSRYHGNKWSNQQYKILIENCQFWGDGADCDSKLGHYLASIEHFRCTQGIEERDLLNNITSTLKGTASKWYLTNLSQCTSLDRFKTLLRERFGARRTKLQRITDLHGRRRKPGISVIQHIDEMIFDATAYELGLDEESLSEMIIQTLSEQEQMTFKLAHVKNMSQLKNVCRDFFPTVVDTQNKSTNAYGNSNQRTNFRSNQSNSNFRPNNGNFQRKVFEVENQDEAHNEDQRENECSGQESENDQYWEDNPQDYIHENDEGEVNEVQNRTQNHRNYDKNRSSFTNGTGGQSFKSNGNYNRNNTNYNSSDRTNMFSAFDLNKLKEFLVLGQKLVNNATQFTDSSNANRNSGQNNSSNSKSRIYCYGCGKENVTFWDCDTKSCLEQIQAKNLKKSLSTNAPQTPKPK